jgi:hypothetical protein
LLVLEKPSFLVDAEGVSGERPIRADDAMTRHDDRDRVRPVGRANRARRVRRSDGASDVSVGGGGPGGNLPQRIPNALLKVGPASRKLERIERAYVSIEVCVERAHDLFGDAPVVIVLVRVIVFVIVIVIESNESDCTLVDPDG